MGNGEWVRRGGRKKSELPPHIIETIRAMAKEYTQEYISGYLHLPRSRVRKAYITHGIPVLSRREGFLLGKWERNKARALGR